MNELSTREYLEANTSSNLHSFCFIKTIGCLDFKNAKNKKGVSFIRYQDLDQSFSWMSEQALNLVKAYHKELYSPELSNPTIEDDAA